MKDKIVELRLLGKSYREIQKKLNCSKSTISFHCKKLELNNPIEKQKSFNKIILKRNCTICNKDFISKHSSQITCSLSCGSKKKAIDNYNNYIIRWKNGEEKGGNEKYGKVSSHIRRFLFEKYDNKCAQCGWSEVNRFTNTIPLEVEHIDGNPTNHIEENLTLLCPNCHSLTAGHSTSKGNGRRYYREKYNNG
jgi:hypothetical protein